MECRWVDREGSGGEERVWGGGGAMGVSRSPFGLPHTFRIFAEGFSFKRKCNVTVCNSFCFRQWARWTAKNESIASVRNLVGPTRTTFNAVRWKV